MNPGLPRSPPIYRRYTSTPQAKPGTRSPSSQRISRFTEHFDEPLYEELIGPLDEPDPLQSSRANSGIHGLSFESFHQQSQSAESFRQQTVPSAGGSPAPPLDKLHLLPTSHLAKCESQEYPTRPRSSIGQRIIAWACRSARKSFDFIRGKAKGRTRSLTEKGPR